ncbi:MAG TPA: ATP-binding protein [Blastocatellia bacterium]|nr:ATP-binding protein [Blastocatellia bacterium]
MEFLGNLELFSRTLENRFVFYLFDLLLCGIILLVIVRGWRTRARILPSKNQLFLLLAFLSLGASFALGAVFTGAFFFFRSRLPETSFELLMHIFHAGAWLLLATSAYHQPSRGQTEHRNLRAAGSSLSLLVVMPAGMGVAILEAGFYHTASVVLDGVDVLLLGLILFFFARRPLGGRSFATIALACLLVAATLHFGSLFAQAVTTSLVVWNLEQLAWSFSLLIFAFAIGETSRDLFDKVFVRMQIAFIVLASLMILGITQTEKTEYLASIRDRSEQLAEFVRTHVDYLREQNESLPQVVEREDFLQRAMLGFGNLPELKVIRVVAGGQVATFETTRSGEIERALEAITSAPPLPRLDTEDYFLINSYPLSAGGSGQVEFYGTREFLDRHIRNRIILIFSLFTGVVALSTVMIGLVVRGASATIHRQAREIEDTQQQLLQASKLAALGELAAGVAHEINNPATAILSRASFLLSEEEPNGRGGEREDLKAIVSQAQRIARITTGLLRFSGPHALTLEPVDLAHVVDSSIRPVEEQLEASRISVDKEVEPGLKSVLADEDALGRALENLFRNAIDAMPHGGTLSIRAANGSPDDGWVRLEISDTGAGIEPENIARVFDPFFTTKEVGKGTGLGLSIVHGIIKDHQGTIKVESRPHAGTSFVINLRMEE